ncbi:restriction endonuclease subunit S [Vibrio parahaemolyticus]|nr:restriction endonuclease subunit S [Vibrio parahaemolyticus]MBE3819715.1 restriction endonuclease subunit S [Vibrio parahaemolyticus]MBM5118926.1 restriction endonuclease subunit S [Vibrio parahaemolyticus]MBM5122347.1 restriction endonuclease subunit S [Vibrio parahaemolyticus]MBM5130622.1 restriction endonuclease subunit S [Vibrio parahaemolyticus]
MSKQNKKYMPKLRFPEFLANPGWEGLYGNQAFEQISDKDHNSDLPILAITQEYGAIPREMIDYNVSVSEKSVQSYKVVDVGDFVISLRSFQGGIEYSEYKGLCSPAYVILRSKKGVDKRFFKQYFKTQSFIRDLTKNLEGLRDGKIISYKKFSEVLLPKPSLEEQRKIADCLSSIDELIEAEAQKLDELRAHKKGLMQQLFPAASEELPKLRFPEFLNQNGWEPKTLGEVCHMQAGKFVRASEIIHESADGLYPCFGGNGLRGYTRTFTHVGKYSLIGRQGALCGNVNLVSGSFHATEHAVVVTPTKSVDTDWLFYMLVNLNLNQYATGQAQPGLSVDNLEKVALCIPCNIKEQKKIAEFLDSIKKLIDDQTEKLSFLKLYKKGLMQQLFPLMEKMGI